MRHQAGGHFLQLPDPGFIAAPTFVRCGPAFAVLASKTIEVLKAVGNTTYTITLRRRDGLAVTSALHSPDGVQVTVENLSRPLGYSGARMPP